MVLPFAEVVAALFHAEPFRWRSHRDAHGRCLAQFDPDDLPGDLAEKERLATAGAGALVTTPARKRRVRRFANSSQQRWGRSSAALVTRLRWRLARFMRISW